MSNVAPPQGWHTTDEQEIEKRRQRAARESMEITNLDPRHPIFSNFEVIARSGRVYRVEIRDLAAKQVSCTCVDFRTNGLGACKHTEGVLLHLRSQHKLLYSVAESAGSPRIDVVPDTVRGTFMVERNLNLLPLRARPLFGPDGRLAAVQPEEAFKILSRSGVANLRLSQDLTTWLDERLRIAERKQLRRDYESRVQSGEWPASETLQPLFPYQREGMLHLAFTERAILADEMGLGKIVEAVAASALLQRLGKARRAVIVTPAALVEEWKQQLRRFTQLPAAVLPAGGVTKHFAADPPFFTLVAHEELTDPIARSLQELRPDILILDDAQRMRNWNTPLAQALKYFETRYLFILTGAPIFEQIERLFLLMDLVSPSVLGPLFRFNRDYYRLDEDGRPVAPRNLEQLHQRVRPFILRRTKQLVEHELPELSYRTYSIDLSADQAREHAAEVSRLRSLLQRTLREAEEEEKSIARGLANTVLQLANGASVKLSELEVILEECRDNREFKIVIFAESEESLARIHELCGRIGLAAARLPRRPREFQRSEARVFLGAGAELTQRRSREDPLITGAHAVIHFDVPLNAEIHARRLASVWRKGMPHVTSVIYLTACGTIEPKLLEEFHQTAELPNLLPEEEYSSWAGRLLRLLPQVSESIEAESPEERAEQSRIERFVQAAEAAFGKSLLRIEELGNPFDSTRRRLLVVLDKVSKELPDLSHVSGGLPIVYIDGITHAAGQELIRKEILPPPVFPPRVLL